MTLRCKPLLAVALLTTAACYHRTHTITYNAGANRFEDVPAFVGTGDRIRVVTIDSTYGNLYTVKTDTTALVVGDRAALFGAIDLASLLSSLPANVLPLSENETKSLVASLFPLRPNMTDFQRELGLKLLLDTLEIQRSRIQRALDERCDAERDTVTNYFVTHPAETALLHFLTDTNAYRVAGEIAADTALRMSIRRYASDTRARTKAEIDELQTKSRAYSRRVALLGVLGFAHASLKPNRDSMYKMLARLEGCTKAPAGDLRELEISVDVLKDSLARLTSDTSGRGGSRRAIYVTGVDVAPLVAPFADEAKLLRKFLDDLAVIDRDSKLIIGAANLLPSYAFETNRDTAWVGPMWRPMRLKLTPIRSSRFPQFVPPVVVSPQYTFTPAVASAEKPPAAAPVAAPAFSQTLSVGGATIAISSTGPAPAASASSLTSVEIDVLQRTRFHVGVGLLASRMRTQDYRVVDDTAADTKTVTLSGESPNRKLPVATLAYSVFPLEGKVFGAQAYQFELPGTRNVFKWVGLTTLRTLGYAYHQMGLGATLGLSLEKPFENVFGGITTEVFPGISVGFGRHYGYVPVANVATLPATVPYADGEPVVKRWQQANAWSYTIDGAVVVSALGKLVGLK